MTAQLPLPFGPHKLARRYDPATSRAAAEDAKSLRARHHAEILCAIADGPGNAWEIAERIGRGISGVQVCRRLAELERKGLVHDTGRTSPTPSGRAARMFALGEKHG